MLLLVMSGASSLAADWQPYQARYAVQRNGKLLAEANITFAVQGDHWSISSEGFGTRGLARMLRAKETEYAEGRFHEGQFQPQSYSYHKRVASVDDEWSASFDWHGGKVDITKGHDVLTMDMGEGALDDLSLRLELQRRLRDNEPGLEFLLVDEDEIKERAFRSLPAEYIETDLGCLKTIPVERLNMSGERYTKGWHAPELDYLMVRLENRKSNGDLIEMVITDLDLGQGKIKSGAPCVGPVN